MPQSVKKKNTKTNKKPKGQMTIDEKRDYAEILYCERQLTAKAIHLKIGVSEKTLSGWKDKYGWDRKRKRLLITRESQLSLLYDQLEELNKEIAKRDEGKRYANSKEADSILKLTAAIKNLETDLALGDHIKAMIEFIKHLQATEDTDKAMEITALCDGYIQNLATR